MITRAIVAPISPVSGPGGILATSNPSTWRPNEGLGKCLATFRNIIQNLAHFLLTGGGAGADKEAFVLFIFDKYRAR